jgi:hypothetical protein
MLDEDKQTLRVACQKDNGIEDLCRPWIEV